ncbi:MAG: hypothetical protein Q8P15_03845 [Nanoarchaeota archaeon]|nr:hypothetical protein [Nanoarchaeota archaeon]
MSKQVIEKKKGANWFIVLMYFLLGVYFVNYPFGFFEVPEIILQNDIWIIFVGGLFLLFGGINYFRVKKLR